MTSMLRPRISMPAGGGPMASLVMLAGNTPALSTAPGSGDSGFGGWLDGYGVIGTIDGGNPKDVDYDVFGASGGVDYRFGDRFLVGGGHEDHVAIQRFVTLVQSEESLEMHDP